MKLRSCHIDNFGKLSDLHLEFQDGVNLFHEPNAWGKSTLAAFLRVMFYGFDSKRESGLFDKERVVFRPWQGGTYGGELDFSYQGKEYRISRTFGKTEKTDVFHLYDLSTNLECHDFSSEIGSEIFGLDSASFKRSAFIAQNDCECCSTDAINAKLGNLVENTNDINNFETAQKKIHDRMNKLSPDRATGSMKKRTNMITLLTEELRGYDAAEASYKKITEKLTEKQEHLYILVLLCKLLILRHLSRKYIRKSIQCLFLFLFLLQGGRIGLLDSFPRLSSLATCNAFAY